MHGWSTGPIIILERKKAGLFHQNTVYKGYLAATRNLSGYSVNKSFKQKYHSGDKVEARYRMITLTSGPKKGEEGIEFEILED